MYFDYPLIQCTKNEMNKDTRSCFVHLSNVLEMGRSIFEFDPSRDKEYHGLKDYSLLFDDIILIPKHKLDRT